jgi:hypothetical protein
VRAEEEEEMKAVERAKLVRSLRQESRRLRLLVLVIGFFLVTLTFVVVSKPDALLFNRTARTATIPSPLFSQASFSLCGVRRTGPGADLSGMRCLVAVNGRLSVDQAPRSLLIRHRQRIDADDAASRRSADTLSGAAAAEDPKVVDDEGAGGEEATSKAKAKGESLLSVTS